MSLNNRLSIAGFRVFRRGPMRKVHVLTLVVLAALVLSGAGAALARQETSLTLMGWSSSQAEDEALAQQIAAFEEANPGITVEVNLVPDYDTTLQTTIASGDPPDVFYIDSSRLDRKSTRL